MARHAARWQDDAARGSVVGQAIAGFDDDQLVSLLSARPDLTEPLPPSLGALQKRAGSWASVLACYHTLDLAGQQVVQALGLLPDATTIAELADLLGPGVTTEELVPVLDRLASLALAMRDNRLRLAEICRDTTNPAGLGPPLAELTSGLRTDDVRAIARQIGANHQGRKSEVEEAVRAELTRPGRVEDLLATSTQPTVELALALAAGPPTVSVPYAYYSTGRDETPVEWLRARGLVVSVGWEYATMPREVAITLRGGRIFPDLRPARPPLELRSVDAVVDESAAMGRARELVNFVARLLEECEQRPGTLLKSGGVGIRDVRRVAGVIGVGEAKAAQVIELAAAAGLPGRDNGRLLPASGFDACSASDTTSRWASLVQAWLELHDHLSVAGSPDANGKPIPPMVRTSPDSHATRVRRLLLASMAELAAGTAPTVESLVEQLSWSAPSAWVDGPEPGVLVGELEMFGLSDNGALTSLGRALAEGGVPQARDALQGLLPPDTREFVLQADFTAISTSELAPDVRLELELMADLESSGAASVYRFSSDSLRRAFDIGRDSESLLAFLHEHAPRGVPQPLAYLVADLGRRFGQLRVSGVGAYVRSDDTALLAELTRVRALAPLGLSLIAPTVLTTHADGKTALEALRAQGYLPAAEGPDGEPTVLQPVRRRAAVSPSAPEATGPDLVGLVARLRQTGSDVVGRQLTLVRGLELPDLDSGDGTWWR
jgi:Helicase conserved C-terminal domain